MEIAIIGYGHAGLLPALCFATAEVAFPGLGIDPAMVEALNANRSYIKHTDGAAIQSAASDRSAQ